MPYPDVGSRCPIAGCTCERRAPMLMCGAHWKMVPGEIAREVYAAWKVRQDGVMEGGERYRMATARHEAAKMAAIDAVERLLAPLDASESVHVRAERRGDAFEEAARKAGDI